LRKGAGNEAQNEAVIDALAESSRFAWLMAALLFAVGGAIGALSLILAHPSYFDDSALWGNIGLSFAGAVVCFAGAAWSWPMAALYAVVALGVLAVTRAGYYSHEPGGFYSLFYVWIGLYAMFFFSRQAAIAYLAGIGVAYAWLLGATDADAEAARWVTTIGTVVLGAVLIDTLVGRLRRVAHDSASIARERADLMATLAEVARTDELTGLPNRRAWGEALERELARARRESTPLCIGIVDLDRFKDYNDVHGHQAGDRVLKQLAAAWGAELRITDVLARYGGEEFALALPGCELGNAQRLVERLRAVTPAGQTASAGLVRWDGEESADHLFGRADKALYEAKEAGRDRIVTG